jgi:hypothetical protein
LLLARALLARQPPAPGASQPVPLSVSFHTRCGIVHQVRPECSSAEYPANLTMSGPAPPGHRTMSVRASGGARPKEQRGRFADGQPASRGRRRTGAASRPADRRRAGHRARRSEPAVYRVSTVARTSASDSLAQQARWRRTRPAPPRTGRTICLPLGRHRGCVASCIERRGAGRAVPVESLSLFSNSMRAKAPPRRLARMSFTLAVSSTVTLRPGAQHAGSSRPRVNG